MGEHLASIGPAIANHLWQSTAFAALAWALAALLRRNQARVRYGVWLAASVKFVLPFALLMSLGSMLPRPRHTVVTMPVYTAVDDLGLPFDETSLPAMPATSAALSAAVYVPTLRERAEAALPQMLVLLWAAGFVTILVAWSVRWRRVARTVRAGAVVTEGREAEILRKVEEKILTSGAKAPSINGTCYGTGKPMPLSEAASGPRRAWNRKRIKVRLALSGDKMEPGIYGVFRPILVWPRELSTRLDDDHIEAIFAHELMHIRRRDNLAATLHMFVEAVFWFHPAVWWMGARLVEERERACDEAVVEMGSRPGIYAESLLKAVRFCVESPLVCVAGVTGADLKGRVRSIMTLRLRRLGALGKIALAGLALGTIALPVAFGLVRMIPMYNQVFKATGPPASYEFVVIKPSQEEAHGASTEGEQTHYGVTAKMLVQFAYTTFGPNPSIIDLKVVGGPDWINTDVFSIVGKMSAAEYQQEQGMGRQQRRERRQMMEQSILADRFKLKMHTEMQDQPVYALTVTKPGKLTPAKDATGTFRFNPFPSDAAPESITRGLVVNRVGGHLKMTAKGMDLVELVNALSSQKETGGEHVVDQTGLTGAYDFTLTWGPPDNAGTGASDDADFPPLFTALQQQLGLKLSQAKAPAEVVVIDHIEKPVFDSADNAAAPAQPSMMTTALAEGQRILAKLMPAAMVQDKPASAAAAQDSPGVHFDVISIRPAAPAMAASGGPVRRRVGIGFTDDGLSWHNMPLEILLARAYEMQPILPNRIVSTPDWVQSQSWDIEAKVADADVPAFTQLARDNTPEGQHRQALVLRSFLADQFHLRAHMEPRPGTVYTLEVAKGGIKAKPTPVDPAAAAPDASGRTQLRGPVVAFRTGSGRVEIPDGTIASLASLLTIQLGIPVTDNTGVAGRYNLKLDWQPDTGASAAPTATDFSKPSLSTALEEQLGLKLVQGKGSIDVLVVDHVEKPATTDGAAFTPARLALASFAQAATSAHVSEDEIQQAIDLQAGGNVDGAIEIYRRIISTVPSGQFAAEAQFHLAQALLQKGDLEGAAKEFQTLSQRYPEYKDMVASLTAQMHSGGPAQLGVLKDGRFRNFLTSVELNIPDGYTFTGCYSSSGNGEQVLLQSRSAPAVSVWMKPVVEPIDHLRTGLRYQMNRKAADREEDWSERQDSAQERTFSGHPGLSVVADFTLNGKPGVEYLVWIDTGKTHTQFFGEAPADQLAALKQSVDAVASSATIP